MTDPANAPSSGDRPLPWRLLARLNRALGISTLVGDGRDAVLMYHAVGGVPGTEYPWVVSVERFRRQVQAMSEAFEPVPLEEIVAAPSAHSRFAVTFDDGFRSVATKAAPVLRELGVPATVFVCADLIDADANRVRDCLDLGPGARNILLTPEDISALAEDELFDLGNHTASHADLTTINDDRLADEVAGGHERLEERFNVKIDGFSYPYGAVDDRTAAAVADIHEFAVTTEPTLVPPQADPHRLPRVDTTKEADILLLETTGLGDRLRRAARSLG